MRPPEINDESPRTGIAKELKLHKHGTQFMYIYKVASLVII